jgi:hypothetical protein
MATNRISVYMRSIRHCYCLNMQTLCQYADTRIHSSSKLTIIQSQHAGSWKVRCQPEQRHDWWNKTRYKRKHAFMLGFTTMPALVRRLQLESWSNAKLQLNPHICFCRRRIQQESLYYNLQFAPSRSCDSIHQCTFRNIRPTVQKRFFSMIAPLQEKCFRTGYN